MTGVHFKQKEQARKVEQSMRISLTDSADEPTAGEPTPDESTADEPTADESIADDPTADEATAADDSG